MGTPEDDTAYSDACRKLLHWETRLQSPTPSTPENGSRLAADDTALHGMPTSELIHVSLVTATESLQLVRETLAQTEKYVNALHGAIRTAILGASHAIWALEPRDDDLERLTRQALTHREYHAQFAAYLESLPDRSATDELLEMQRERRDEFRRILASMGAEGTRISDTKVIAWATQHVLAEGNAIAVQSYWRLLSGDAHALGWPLLINRSRSLESIDGGIATGVASPDTDMTKHLFRSGVEMVDAAWPLFFSARKG